MSTYTVTATDSIGAINCAITGNDLVKALRRANWILTSTFEKVEIYEGDELLTCYTSRDQIAADLSEAIEATIETEELPGHWLDALAALNART